MNKKNLFVAGASFLIASGLFIYLQRPSLRVLNSWKQSELINYDSFDPYFLNVVEDNFDMGHLPFTMPRNYFFYIGKESDAVTYGHVKNFSFEYHTDIHAYLEKCSVEWTPKGVMFKEPDGHALFFPKEFFIGGR